MISNATKELINLAILKLELDNPTQIVVNEAVEYLKRAVEQVKSENNAGTQEELLARFPVEPNYPELKLADFNIEIYLKN